MTLSKGKEEALSRLMSYILRHNPYKFGLRLNDKGYCSLTALLTAIKKERKFEDTTLDDIKQVVQNCEKQRYEITNNKVRARYGHSKVRALREPSTPPTTLIHGTVENRLPSIKEKGLLSMERQHVHLATEESKDFAILSANRRAKNTNVVLLIIDTVKAQEKGVLFYDEGKGTWLSTPIPPECINWSNTRVLPKDDIE